MPRGGGSEGRESRGSELVVKVVHSVRPTIEAFPPQTEQNANDNETLPWRELTCAHMQTAGMCQQNENWGIGSALW